MDKNSKDLNSDACSIGSSQWDVIFNRSSQRESNPDDSKCTKDEPSKAVEILPQKVNELLDVLNSLKISSSSSSSQHLNSDSSSDLRKFLDQMKSETKNSISKETTQKIVNMVSQTIGKESKLPSSGTASKLASEIQNMKSLSGCQMKTPNVKNLINSTNSNKGTSSGRTLFERLSFAAIKHRPNATRESTSRHKSVTNNKNDSVLSITNSDDNLMIHFFYQIERAIEQGTLDPAIFNPQIDNFEPPKSQLFRKVLRNRADVLLRADSCNRGFQNSGRVEGAKKMDQSEEEGVVASMEPKRDNDEGKVNTREEEASGCPQNPHMSGPTSEFNIKSSLGEFSNPEESCKKDAKLIQDESNPKFRIKFLSNSTSNFTNDKMQVTTKQQINKIKVFNGHKAAAAEDSSKQYSFNIEKSREGVEHTHAWQRKCLSLVTRSLCPSKVNGMAILQETLYFIMENRDKLFYISLNNLRTNKTYWEKRCLLVLHPIDIVSNGKYLFILLANQEVLKINPVSENSLLQLWKIPGHVMSSVKALALRRNGNLLIVNRSPSFLAEFDSNGNAVRNIFLPMKIVSISHAVELSQGRFAICSNVPVGIYIVDARGSFVASTDGTFSPCRYSLNLVMPRYLAVDSKGFLYVADRALHKIILLSETLNFIKDFSLKDSKFACPDRLLYNEQQQLLYFACSHETVWILASFEVF